MLFPLVAVAVETDFNNEMSHASTCSGGSSFIKLGLCHGRR
jgi:hypothetical protein